MKTIGLIAKFALIVCIFVVLIMNSLHMIKLLLIFFLLFTSTLFAEFIPLDRKYTLKNAYSSLLEIQNQNQIYDSSNTSYTYPNHNFTSKNIDLYANPWIQYSQGESSIRVIPLIDLEYRYHDSQDDYVKSVGTGGILKGKKAFLDFTIDARMYSEFHSQNTTYSYDREYIEVQKDGENSSLSFISYSRYRANFNLNLPFGDIGYSRSSLHWGPGTFHNLMFHQDAVPFNQFYYQGEIGPIRVTSMWGPLSIDGAGRFRNTDSTRSVYAHRYELNITSNILLGINEQLIVYNMEEPTAIIPIVPLFMLKGQGLENRNNGNLSMDLSYRFRNMVSVYTEFLIDDVSEPTSLFNDYWKNKWALMFGAHYARKLKHFEVGYIVEYSRIEPWVYTHYISGTAQSANHGHPLGNQLGPNSQAFTNKVYFRSGVQWYAGAKLDLTWKGTDYGSSLEDYRADQEKEADGSEYTKEFIQGIGSPDIVLAVDLNYTFKFCVVHMGLQTLNSKVNWDSRLGFYF